MIKSRNDQRSIPESHLDSKNQARSPSRIEDEYRKIYHLDQKFRINLGRGPITYISARKKLASNF